jgi:hypothetical protein
LYSPSESPELDMILSVSSLYSIYFLGSTFLTGEPEIYCKNEGCYLSSIISMSYWIYVYSALNLGGLIVICALGFSQLSGLVTSDSILF